MIAEDAVGRVAGAGRARYRGRERIFELFRETRGSPTAPTGASFAGPSPMTTRRRRLPRAAPLGRELDIDQVLLITLRDGRWQEVVAVPTDPEAFEAFWC